MNARLLPLLVLVFGCSDLLPDAPSALTIAPNVGRFDQPTRVVVGGSFRTASVRVDYNNTARSAVRGTMTLHLDGTKLVDVRVVDAADEPACPSDQPSCVEATVPAGMPVGMHALIIVDPDGASSTMADAFRILTSAERVMSLRIDPIGEQVAGVPFDIAVIALDEAEEVVADFDGAATIDDLDGNTIGTTNFAAGRLVTPVVRTVARADDEIRIAAANVARVSNRFVVGSGDARRLTTAGPIAMTAGVCSAAFVISPRDLFDNSVTTTGDVRLTVTAGGNADLFADATCTTATAAATLGAGAANVGVFARSTQVGPFELRVDSVELGAATAQSTVVAGAPARLTLTVDNDRLKAGVCSSAFRANTFDEFGNLAASASNTALNLTGTLPGTFYTDSACSNAVSEVDVVGLETEADFYFVATSTGSGELSADAPALGIATATISVAPGPAAKLRFGSPARTVEAGACASLTAQRTDDFGNPAVEGVLDVVVSASSPDLEVFGDAACGIPTTDVSFADGDSTASFYARSSRVGGYDVTVARVDLASATQRFTVVSGVPASLAITQVVVAPEAGACVGPWTVERRDGFGNSAPDVSVTSVDLSSTPAVVDFFADVGCTVLVAGVDIAAGQSTANFYAVGRSVGDTDIGADATGLIAGRRTVSFSSGAVDRLALFIPASIVAGACTSATVAQHDVTDTPVVTALARIVDLAPTMPAGFAVYDDAVCSSPVTEVTITAGDTDVMFFVRGQTVGAGSLAASTTGLTSDTAPITVAPGAPDRLVMLTPPRSVVAGVCSPLVQVEVRDTFANPVLLVGGKTVDLTRTPLSPTWSFYDDAGCTNAVGTVVIGAGQARVSFYFMETTVGAATVDAAMTGVTSATQSAMVDAAAPYELRFDSSAQQIPVSDCSSAAVVSSRDEFGNTSAPAFSLTVPLFTAAPGVTFYSDASCTNLTTSATLAGGSTSFTFYFVGTNKGSATLTADHNSYTVGAAQVAVFTSCADGVVDIGESCDDGDTTAGDGCSATCTVEAGWVCAREPSWCVASAIVAVTDDSGPSCPGTGAGTEADPYCTFADAIASGQPNIIVRPGNYPEQVILDSVSLTIVADDGAVVASSSSDAVLVTGTADVRIVGLAVRDATNDIVEVSGSARLVLVEVEIGPGPNHGVHSHGSSRIEMERCHIHDTASTGFIANGSGGFYVSNSLFEGGGSLGVRLQRRTLLSSFVNNTVADHGGRGVQCDNSDILLNVIVWNNAGGGVEAACIPRYSNLQAAHSHFSNFFTDPLFTADGTYHLQPTSPCIDAGQSFGAPSDDIDGQARPMGSGDDVGADEAG